MTVSELRPVELIDAPAYELQHGFARRLSRILGIRFINPQELNAAGLRHVDEMIVRAYRDCCSVGGRELGDRVLKAWRDAYPERTA